MSGELFRELEEDIHQEEWWAFWRTYGLLIGGVVFLTFLIAGGYLLWRTQTENQLETDSTHYETALALLEAKGPNAEAQKILEDLAQKGSEGYALLAGLRLFRLHAAASKTDTDAYAATERQGHDLLTLAQKTRNLGLEGVMVLNLSALSLNAQRPVSEVLRARLAGYDVPQNPWKALSLEIQALNAVHQNQTPEAQKLYTQLLTAQEVTQSVQMRAGMEAIGQGLSLPERAFS